MKRKWLAFGIILLFVGVTVAPSITANIPIAANVSNVIGALNFPKYEGTLSGYVNDSEKKPIEGVRVRVYFHDTYRENYSDLTGYYHVTDILICNCTKNSTCSKEGYDPKSVWLSIDENTTYDFVLYRSNFSLSIGNISGFFWKIGTEISNTGLCNITNITWTIYTYKVTSPILFGKGTIPVLSAGTSKYVHKFRPAVFGLGWFTILVRIEGDDAAPIEKRVDAFAFYFIILYIKNIKI